MSDSEDEPEVKAVHDLATSLRNEGYTVGFDSRDLVEDFDDHTEAAQDTLDADDLGAFFVVSHRDGQSDYSSSVVVNDSVAWGVIQIEMLGAHFRTVLDALPLTTSELVDAMVDEAITIDEVDSTEDDRGQLTPVQIGLLVLLWGFILLFSLGVLLSL